MLYVVGQDRVLSTGEQEIVTADKSFLWFERYVWSVVPTFRAKIQIQQFRFVNWVGEKDLICRDEPGQVSIGGFWTAKGEQITAFS